MDDYKRGLYLQVRSELERRSTLDLTLFVCFELNKVLLDEGSLFDPNSREGHLQDLFPEFFALFDGFEWFDSGLKCKIEMNDAWWSRYWLEPRIRALDCILRD